MAGPVLAACVTVFALMAGVTVRDFAYPEFYWEDTMTVLFLKQHLRLTNLTCEVIELGPISASYNHDAVRLLVPSNTNTATCTVDSHLNGVNSGKVYATLTIKRVEIDLMRTYAEHCMTTGTTRRVCDGAIHIEDLRFSSKLNIIGPLLKPALNIFAQKALCTRAVPLVQENFIQRAAAPAVDLPVPHPLDTPVNYSSMVVAIANVAQVLPTLWGVKASVTAVDANVLRATATFTTPLNVSFNNLTLPTRLPVGIPKVLARDELLLRFLDHLDEHLQHNLRIDATQVTPETPLLTVTVPANATVSAEIWVRGFNCTTSEDCVLSRDGGIELRNIRASGMGDFDSVVTNELATYLQDNFNQVMDVTLRSFPGTVPFTSIERPAIVERPPLQVVVLTSLLMGVAWAGLLLFSAVRHWQAPITGPHGPVSMLRVLLEDGLLTFATFATMFLFAWANSTTLAVVTIGKELPFYTFSLWNTVYDLWSAGLICLSILAFIFSGMYPYMRLFGAVLCTVILQQPNNYVFMLMDLFGRFSLVYVFALMVLASGLEIPGVVDLQLLPSFYLFLIATVLSMAVSNYAVYAWRFNTSVRPARGAKRRERHGMLCMTETPHEACAERVAGEYGTGRTLSAPRGGEMDCGSSRGLGAWDAGWKGARQSAALARAKAAVRWWDWRMSLVMLVLVGGTAVVSWVVPAFAYVFDGLATMVVGERKELTMWAMSMASHWTLVVMVLLTTLIAPVVYAVFYEHVPFLASWCATDVMLVVCVLGLRQLEPLVVYILGDNLTDVYSARAELLWPMIPLAVSVGLQWLLTLRQVVVEALDEDDEWVRDLFSREDGCDCEAEGMVSASRFHDRCVAGDDACALKRMEELVVPFAVTSWDDDSE